MKRGERELCECEKHGATNSGIRGIICCWENGMPVNIQRCDACMRFPDDDTAALFMLTWTPLKTLRMALDRIQEISRDLTKDRLRNLTKDRDNPWYKQVRAIDKIATDALRLDKRIVKHYAD